MAGARVWDLGRMRQWRVEEDKAQGRGRTDGGGRQSAVCGAVVACIRPLALCIGARGDGSVLGKRTRRYAETETSGAPTEEADGRDGCRGKAGVAVRAAGSGSWEASCDSSDRGSADVAARAG